MCFFYASYPIQSSFPSPHPLFWTLTLQPYSALVTWDQVPDNWGQLLCPRAPERIQTDSQPAYLASPVPVHGSPNEAFGLRFDLVPSASWLTLGLPYAALHGMTCLLFLRICEDKLPWWQSFPCLHVSPYLITTNPWCVLKQSHSET